MKIKDPMIELLAIKLFEHDHQGVWPPKGHPTSWMAIAEEDRQTFRDMASGKRDAYT